MYTYRYVYVGSFRKGWHRIKDRVLKTGLLQVERLRRRFKMIESFLWNSCLSEIKKALPPAVQINSRFTTFNTTLSQKVVSFLVQLLYARRLEGKKLRQGREKNIVRILLVVAMQHLC